MKSLHFIFIFVFALFNNLVIPNNIFGQSAKGYLITKNGGIKNGKILHVYRFFEGGFVRFIDERGKKARFQPEDIDGFGIGDTTYISLQNLNFTPPNSNKEIKSDFAKVLVDDDVSLYEFAYKKEQVWGATPKSHRFILKKSTDKELYWLNQDISQMQAQLQDYFKEIPELQNTLSISGISAQNPSSSLVNYVRLYNKLLKEKEK